MKTPSRRKELPTGMRIWLLVVAQSLNMLMVSVVFAFSSIVSKAVFGYDGLATLPLTVLMISAAMATLPISIVIHNYSQRAGFVVGAVFGAVGAGVCAWAVLAGDFTLYNVGHIGLGVFQGSAMYYRFAAADTAAEINAPAQARAISWVIAGGLAAALVGPEFAARTRILASTDYVGSFAAVALLLSLSAGLLSLFRAPAGAEKSLRSGHSLAAMIRDRVFLVAVINATVAYVIMSYVMSAAPLAVTAAGHDVDAAAAITRWHLVGMFAPSFFTGRLVELLGIPKLLLIALALLVGSVGIGAASTNLISFRMSLLGLGVGWNLLFVGGTILLTEAYPAAGQTRLRAANDFIVLAAAAAATFLAGSMHATFGWTGINLSVIPFVMLAGAATLWLRAFSD